MTPQLAIKRALRKLGVIASGESPSHDEAADGLTCLNAMLHRWKIEGVDLNHISVTLTQTLPYPPSHDDPIVSNLAIEYASEFGIPIKPELAVIAGRGFTALQNHYANPREAVFDDALYSAPENLFP